MAKSKKKQQEDKAKALGCAIGAVILLGFSACNAIFGDDEPDPLTIAPTYATSSSAPPATDTASQLACTDSVQAAAFRKAGRKNRADELDLAAVEQAVKSKVPELAELGAVPTDTDIGQLRTWCAANHPEITPDPVKPKAKTTRKPRPPKTSKPAAPSTDPRFVTCGAANAAGYGPYYRGQDPEYSWYIDRDGDGVVCER